MGRLDFLGSIAGGTKEVHANAKNLLFVPDDPGDSQSGCRNLTVPRSMNVIRNKPWRSQLWELEPC
jgi:hypothetical protein